MIRRESRTLMGMSGALFSDCEKYRYLLWRRWHHDALTARWCNFIMLNPSTATEEFNDPTVERCERRAHNMGYTGLYVTNLFALRETNPNMMRRHPHPIGDDNDTLLVETAKLSELVVCAWGNYGTVMRRSAEVRQMLQAAGVKPYALKVAMTGEPCHPLYLSYSLEPKEYAL